MIVGFEAWASHLVKNGVFSSVLPWLSCVPEIVEVITWMSAGACLAATDGEWEISCSTIVVLTHSSTELRCT